MGKGKGGEGEDVEGDEWKRERCGLSVHCSLSHSRPVVVGDKRASQGPIMSSSGPVTKRIRITDPAKQVSRYTHLAVVDTH